MYSKNTENWLSKAGHVKPKNFSLKDTKKLELAVSLIEEEVKELKESLTTKNYIEVLDALGDIQVTVNNFIHFSGLKENILSEAIELIEKSNFSKYCNTEEEAQKTIDAYAEGNHPDKIGKVIPCYYEKIDEDTYIIKRTKDNKIMKSYYYEPVDLSHLI